ncbi:uncharacterized protein L969DRAFT_45170 [Mixia osmundae IAM 14324]|uniref:Methyltransferase type 12 domain-containing protein n=1 Tax=Mixia osmundae (strain CBS 9802 / IAM 14324 / JCM 22182 / KY 12970) TaxID=764103 RepID=G7DXF2_MIXOS|nr:uncharacterized protein L969DRAFT_45170 [Mixia osmundae IAM 14324]KEI41244.1 hypothetical protein L969DRAFT_45170 [Mixia osmundae IAM 14324]GAA95262.1 hypothetical protein E5Q_01918 [Mixia osmundae IAM 14324]
MGRPGQTIRVLQADAVADAARSGRHDRTPDDDVTVSKSDVINGAPFKQGGRLLTDEKDPWAFNAWDNVEWTSEQEKVAEEAITRQKQHPVPAALQEQVNATPAIQWDNFYARVKTSFFKDRAWLTKEFPDLERACRADRGPCTVAELGCGTGATVYPLLKASENPLLTVHALDYSHEAIQLVRSHPDYNVARVKAAVYDLACPGLPEGMAEHSVDIVTCIFVLSALHPREWHHAASNIWRMLKPGGILLFRDYGRYDLAQLRYQKGRYMQDHLYIRGDNTRCYYFEREDLISIFSSGEPSGSARFELDNLGDLAARTLDTITF